MPQIISQWPNEQFRSGRFVYRVEDNTVHVSKDTKGGIISVGMYAYKTYEVAAENAWRMAVKQSRA